MKTQLKQSVDRSIRDDEIRQLAAEASLQWTGTFNPAPMTPACFEQLYRNAI